MRAITTDIKVLVGRLGPLVSKALEGAIRRAMEARNAEVTPDHLLRALLDFADSDLSVSMADARIERKDVVSRLDWHLGRLPGNAEGKPRLSHAMCLLLEDAGTLTKDRLRSGHIVASVLGSPGLSASDMAKTLSALPRIPLHLLSSKVEDKGEVGRILPPTPAAPTTNAAPAAKVELAAKAEPAVKAEPSGDAPKPASAAASEVAKPAAGATAPVSQENEEPKTGVSVKIGAPQSAAVESEAPRGNTKQPINADAIRAMVVDRFVSEDDGGLTIRAEVGTKTTTLRLDWDRPGRVIVLKIALVGERPTDDVRTAVALSTLNNAIPHGTFVVDGGHLAFRSHVFLDSEGMAPLETLAFAIRICEEAAEAV
ncbi:MAG: hypothetical protein IPK82_34190 [Polyangiaceae bacterium]|nr:hypothetical protein [Polyangiaceae bacterium]